MTVCSSVRHSFPCLRALAETHLPTLQVYSCSKLGVRLVGPQVLAWTLHMDAEKLDGNTG